MTATRTPKPRKRSARLIMIWGLGFLAALLIANTLALTLTNSVDISVWDEAIGYGVRKAGERHRHRSEGWAETRIGRHGVPAIADVAALTGPKVIFWGDSHVEGFGLADEDKVAQQLNRLPEMAGSYNAYAVGMSGTTVATAYHLIPAFERLTPEVAVHFIVITRRHYILPESHGNFRALPQPHLEVHPQRPDPGRQKVLRVLNRWRFELPIQLNRRVESLDLRFRPGHLAPPAGPAAAAPLPIAAWSYLLKSLQERTEVPIVFLYCPQTPRLEQGEVSFTDPDAAMMEEFATLARRAGAAFVNLAGPFAELYRDEKRFPHGFSNSNPHRGHLNRYGTRCLAVSAARFLIKEKDALHPDRISGVLPRCSPRRFVGEGA